MLLNMLWFATILGVANGMLWPSAVMLLLLLTVLFIYQGISKLDLKIMAFSVLCGLLFDGFLAHQGTLTYPMTLHQFSFLPPMWILFLWVGFAATARVGLQWLLQNPLIGGTFMLIGAPLSYYSAAKLGAVVINDFWHAMTFVGLTWLLYFAVLVWFTQAKEARDNAVA
ncbi:DUF2878 domain-containing protein [Marinicella meishanensis]|uniref:DUF2878 domain-containing protein n=1 Tax=Marinicella meishanensis TaxID=2873263 RepID=UPI001CBE6A49|nr:DUF2878 domain-containing protein [Marinicella sp. NBU2979]